MDANEGASRPGPSDPGRSLTVEGDSVELHAVRAGEESGPLVVLLHGFPEFWYGWRDQIRPLAGEGFDVVVPDQRGYNLSGKPADVAAYGLDHLAADVTALVDALERDRFHVVGHDWGAAVAWWTALRHPDRVASLCAVNVPHPAVLYRTLRRRWSQRLRSAYMLFFQLPALPEVTLRTRNWWSLVRTMRHTSRPGTFSPADFERYRAAWRRPGAATGMLNWYRALVRERPRPPAGPVDPPTLVVWGARDQFLERSMARESVERCRDGRLSMFDDATHWVHHEEPVRVTDLVADHVAYARGAGARE